MDTCTRSWTAAGGWTEPLPLDWDGPRTLVLAFGPAGLLDHPEPLSAVVDAFAGSVVLGCSTSGEICGAELLDGSVTVAVVRFATTTLALAGAPVTDATSGAVGHRLGAQLRAAGEELAGAFVLSDGVDVNGSALAAGLAEGAGPGVVVTGGLASDAGRFERTWVLTGGVPRSGQAVAVGLYGDEVEIGCGSAGGWSILGPERVITRSEGNVLAELDGQPALDLYTTYLGDRAQGLPATALLFPLSVRVPGADGRDLVRTVLAVDEDARTMTFAGEMPVGATAQLMRSTSDRLVEAAQSAAVSATLPPTGPALAIAVSCVGRRLYLGQRTEDELEAVAAALPPSTQLVGFYSNGELSPAGDSGCDLHNQTMTLTVLQERTR